MSTTITSGVQRWALVLGIVTILQGAWAFLVPRSFYDDFPVPDADWVSALGPFNDHLARDFGSTLAALGVVAVIAARSKSRSALRASMFGYVIFGVPHLIFHLTTFAEFSALSLVTQLGGLALFVAVPVGILMSLRPTGSERQVVA